MYGYAYRYSGRPNGVLAFNPLTDINGLSLYLNKNTNVNTKLSQSLDGSTDALNADTLVGDLASTTTGIWAGWVKPVDATPVANTRLWGFGDTNASEYIQVNISVTTGVCRAICRVAGVTQWDLDTNAIAFSDGVWTHVSIVQDGVSPVLYINNVAVAQTFTSSLDKTQWFNDATGIDNGRIGCMSQNSGGDTNFFQGDLDEWGFWSNSTAVTAASLYNSGAGKTLADLTTAEKVGLVGYYTLNDYLDTSGNSNTLTAIGTPTVAVGKVQTVSTVGERVWNWIDQSSNAYIFSNDTVTLQPLLETNDIVFDGTDDSLDKTIANAYSGDSSGIIFFSGYFDNSASNYYLCSSDAATNVNYFAIGVLSSGELFVQNYDGATNSVVQSTNTVVNGAYFYGYIKSTGTTYEINLNGTTESKIILVGNDNGNFFSDIVNRDNLTISYLDKTSTVFAPSKVNKVIYSNDYTIDTAPILNFMSNPDN